jgi:GT2 family glycosyltransferase
VTAPPRVAAVVVSLGDDPRTRACLDALRSSEGVVVSTILVVNGAAPPHGVFRDAAAGTIVLRRAQNPGFAAGFDDGYAEVDPDVAYVASFNPDCRVEKDALIEALAVFERDATIGAVALKLVRPDGRTLDGAGVDVRPITWRAYDRGAEGPHDEPAFDSESDVDAPCFAGAVLSRVAVEAARDGAGDVLDVRFFAYQEDVDFGRRLARAGFRTRYAPKARATHERRWRPGTRRSIPVALRRASLRNRLWTILKNASLGALLVRLPALLLYEGALATYLLLREPDVLPAYRDAWRGAKETLRRRSHEKGA